MAVVQLLVDLEYDEEQMHSGDTDEEARDWFFSEVLKEPLLLHSQDIGDVIGTVNVRYFVMDGGDRYG